MNIQKIHYKIIIRKKNTVKTYYCKYLNLEKVEKILTEKGWKILQVIPNGRIKV